MAERWLQMQASSNSRYPRASHDSYHVEAEEHRTPPSVRRTANKRQSMPTIVQSDVSPDRSTATQGMFRAGNERLYEAYNDLHSLAQDFEKPFDAPAILVVGHQTDGKSGESGRMYLMIFCIYSSLAGAPAWSAVLGVTAVRCSFGGSSYGVPVQPCWWRYKDQTTHYTAHEVQCSLCAAKLLSHYRRLRRAGGDPGGAAGWSSCC